MNENRKLVLSLGKYNKKTITHTYKQEWEELTRITIKGFKTPFCWKVVHNKGM